MITVRTLTATVVDTDIVRAIELKSSACFGSMAVLRSLSSSDVESNDWWLARTFTLRQLADEATRRGLSLGEAKNVDGRVVTESMKYRHAIGLVSDTDLDAWWHRVKRGEIEP